MNEYVKARARADLWLELEPMSDEKKEAWLRQYWKQVYERMVAGVVGEENY